MRRKRKLACQEAQWVNEYITKACLQEGVNPMDETYRSSGWASFMEWYQCSARLWDPGFWPKAYEQVAETISSDKKDRTARLYRELSLDRPISQESTETFLDRLPAKNGDFTNGVAFFDFIGHLPGGLRQLSGCILNGYTLEEARSHLNWNSKRLCETVHSLRKELNHYETC